MNDSYIAYFDSGTTNTRLYLLSERLELVCVEKREIGSRDSAVAGSNHVLMQGLKSMYDSVLSRMKLSDGQIRTIYASGMSTSPYGIKEVPHQVIPISLAQFAKNCVSFHEPRYFGRSIILIPGLKTTGDEVSQVNNMRGEEIEIIGALEELPPEVAERPVAIVLPGSHTHVAFVRERSIEDILSTFSGELFSALKSGTVLAPVFQQEVQEFHEESVVNGFLNLQKYGFNRAVYICHAMRIFGVGTAQEQFSYLEGVLMGGILTALERKCAENWQGCESVVVVGSRQMFELYRIILKQNPGFKRFVWLSTEEKSYAVEGLKRIIRQREQF